MGAAFVALGEALVDAVAVGLVGDDEDAAVGECGRGSILRPSPHPIAASRGSVTSFPGRRCGSQTPGIPAGAQRSQVMATYSPQPGPEHTSPPSPGTPLVISSGSIRR